MAHILRQIALLPALFESTSTPWVYTWIDGPLARRTMSTLLEAGRLPENARLHRLFARLDDTGVPGDNHPGPRSHAAFADELVSWILSSGLLRQAGRGRRTVGRLLRYLGRWRGRGGTTGARRSDDVQKLYPLW
jgi:hypothetical protein